MQVFSVLRTFSAFSKRNRRMEISNDISDISTKLKFISMIKKGEKIDVKTMTVQRTSLMNSLWRLFYQESRENTLDFLTATLDRAFEIFQIYTLTREESNEILTRNLLEDILKSIDGLSNLQSTYSSDRLFLCNLKTLIQSVEIRVQSIKEKNPILFESCVLDKQREN